MDNNFWTIFDNFGPIKIIINPRKFVCPHVQWVATRIQPEHKTFNIMQNNNLNNSNNSNYEVIDQFFAAQVACNESEATLKALRPQVEEAVRALIAERGLGKSFTGTIEYHGIKIVVSRPKSYTWEKNTNPAVTSDPNHAIYVQQLALQEQIAAQLKDMRADVKRTAEKLAKAHPDSESIKRSFRIAIVWAGTSR